MPIVSARGFDISYSCNDAERTSSSGTLVLIHGAGGQEIDWPLAWRSSNDITRELGLTPKGHSNMLDKFQISIECSALIDTIAFLLLKKLFKWFFKRPSAAFEESTHVI